MWQLFQRAYGLFEPADIAWQRADGRFVDPFRPRIQAGGFATVEDLEAEREIHLAEVRRVFEECDVFIFTLGLTEAWVSPTDGAAFPLAPGTVAVDGEAVFHNFTVAEMIVSTSRISAWVAFTSKVAPLRTAPISPQPVTFICTASTVPLWS